MHVPPLHALVKAATGTSGMRVKVDELGDDQFGFSFHSWSTFVPYAVKKFCELSEGRVVPSRSPGNKLPKDDDREKHTIAGAIPLSAAARSTAQALGPVNKNPFLKMLNDM
jgi:hypothetical protein